jgi:hypothetical protein
VTSTRSRAACGRAAAVAALLLALPGLATALDPAGTIPERYFAEDDPAVFVETINDSTGTCVDRVETDDRRSFGLRAYGAAGDFAVGLACDGFTFRGTGTDPGSRSDELSITAAWMGRPLEGGPFSLRLGAGAGLRAWGDFGFIALQRQWHDVLGVSRPFPTAFTESTIRPVAYASADATMEIARSFGAESSIRELALGSGALESSVSLLATQRSGLSSNWAGLSWQGRCGTFDANDALANDYEEGPWIVAGARTGLLTLESSLNLRTNFAVGTIALRFGNARREGDGAGPRQELVVGTSLLQSELSTARFVAIPLRRADLRLDAELRVGVETIVGVSRAIWDDLGCPHFQEASAAVELIAQDRGRLLALRPFAGVALGARQDSLSISDLPRSELYMRDSGFLCKAYAGLRLLEASVPGSGGGRIALDLGAGFSVVTASYPPPEPTLFLRVAVGD